MFSSASRTLVRSRLARSLVAATIVACFSAAAFGQATLTKVRFAYFPAFHTISAMIAKQAGIFKANGLDVQMLRSSSGALLLPMEIGGQADVTEADMVNLARLRAQGKDFIFIYPNVNRLSMNMVASDAAMKKFNVTPSDSLKQKEAALCKMTIGYTRPNAPTDVFSRFYLRQAGCSAHSANLVSIGGPSALIAALKSGRIDAFQLTPPSPNLPVLDGFGQILIKATAGQVPSLDNYPYTGMVTSTAYATSHPQVLTAFVKSLIQAVQYVNDHPNQSLQMLKTYFPTMNDNVLAAGLKDMEPALPKTGLLTQAYVQHYFKINYDLGILSKNIPGPTTEGVLWTNKFTQAALSQLGH